MSDMEKQENDGKSAAQNLGYLFAHIQDGVDFVAEMGFKALKKVGSAAPEKEGNEDTSHPAVQTAKKAGLGVLKFLGEAGDAFYTKYEEIKRERSKKH
jgi:hypothetical protein